MIISLVAAASDNNIIGKNGTLPWRMPADMKFFKSLTMGHTVIMGRKTYESMGKPLAGRKNIVVSRNSNFKAEGCVVVNSVKEAFDQSAAEKEVFVIGGAHIYKEVLASADKIYLTRIHGIFEGDASFPELPEREWVQVKHEMHQQDDKNPYSYTFEELTRKKL